MKIHLLILVSSVFFFLTAQADIAVKADSVVILGYSDLSADRSTVFAGIAGDPVSGTTATSTADTCQSATSSTKACNQTSVHPTLQFKISFQTTKDITNAPMLMNICEGATCTQLFSNTSVTATANSTVLTATTDWGTICGTLGLSTSCVGTSVAASRTIRVGVDEDASGTVDDDELKAYTLKFHYIAPASSATQPYCSSIAAGAGMCNISFIPGDQKGFIDTAIYAGNDLGTTLSWDAIAVFPVESAGLGSDVSVLSGFRTSQADPVFKSFDPTNGTIPDSSVSSGAIENGRRYCFIYGTRNQAKNIYNFVTDAATATTACIEPSDVVGLLEGKACFISTAAFGSDMAPEVQMFREFRNHYLLTNLPGRFFVKTYYQLSPPLAHLIAQHDWLRSLTRFTLYPFLLYAYLTVSLGFVFGTLAMILLAAAVILAVTKLKSRQALIMIFLICCVPTLKAEVQNNETTISHEGAKEGLVKITKDGTYIYDLKRPLKKESSKVTFGQANYPGITLEVKTKTKGTQTYDFDQLYATSPGLILSYDYENYLWTDMGKLGYQLGASLMYATGNGVLVSTGAISEEKFTFLTIPINVGAVYRFEYKDKQSIAPYVSGGGTLLALLEKREDVSTPQSSGGFGFYGAAGVLINTALIDPDAGYDLESEYGISNLWVALEFKATEVTGTAFTYSNRYVSAGLSFDF